MGYGVEHTYDILRNDIRIYPGLYQTMHKKQTIPETDRQLTLSLIWISLTMLFWNDKGGSFLRWHYFDLALYQSQAQMAQLCTSYYFRLSKSRCVHTHHQFTALRSGCIYECVIRFFKGGGGSRATGSEER
jgi:hypothetical protein